MPRPCKSRRINGINEVHYFKPKGIPMMELDEVQLTIDELEAVRLADMEELYQADAAEKMNISRQTFGNIIKSAHKKIAEALVLGKAIRVDGGCIELEGQFPRRRHRRGQGQNFDK